MVEKSKKIKSVLEIWKQPGRASEQNNNRENVQNCQEKLLLPFRQTFILLLPMVVFSLFSTNLFHRVVLKYTLSKILF